MGVKNMSVITTGSVGAVAIVVVPAVPVAGSAVSTSDTVPAAAPED